jgi:hypothetical protein
MSGCGHGGCGGLSLEFARRVELELVYTELQLLLATPPSREVFLEEHCRRSQAEGRTLALREVLKGILARATPG